MIFNKTQNYSKSVFLIMALIILLNGCSYFKKDEKKSDVDNAKQQVLKKKKLNPNLNERAREQADKGITLFGGKEENKLGNQSVIWRAAIETLDFIPLTAASYSGGLIITDWYSKEGSNESIKININFTNNELSASSLEVVAYKKICNSSASCSTNKMTSQFNKKIKDKILAKAIEINVKEESAK